MQATAELVSPPSRFDESSTICPGETNAVRGVMDAWRSEAGIPAGIPAEAPECFEYGTVGDGAVVGDSVVAGDSLAADEWIMNATKPGYGTNDQCQGAMWLG